MLWKKRLLVGRQRRPSFPSVCRLESPCSCMLSDDPTPYSSPYRKLTPPVITHVVPKQHVQKKKEQQHDALFEIYSALIHIADGGKSRTPARLPKDNDSSPCATTVTAPVTPVRQVFTCRYCGRCIPVENRLVERNFAAIILILRISALFKSFEWLLGWTTQIALFISYTKAIELLVVCYFYLDVASKMMHWSSRAGKRLCFSSLILLFTYFTLFLVMGFLLSIEPWTDCHAPYWIWFSSGEFLTVQLMVFSFLLIVNRMKRISASPTIHRRQRTQLLSLFWVFETSCLADLGYHISLFLLANDETGCSGIFKHDQMRFSVLKLPYDIVSFLLPVWTLLYFFRPQRKVSAEEGDSEESYLPPNIPQASDVIVVRNWRRRYRPLVQDNSAYVPAPQLRRVAVQRALDALRSSSSRDASGVRRVSSAPQIAERQRRISVSRSLVSSTLYSIPEEMQHHHSERHLIEGTSYAASGEFGPSSSIDNLSVTGQTDDE